MKYALERAKPWLDGTRTVREVAELAHCGNKMLSNYLKAEHDKGNVHIGSWKPVRNKVAMCYRWGPGVDEPRPVAMSGTERWRRYLERMTAYQRDIYKNRINTSRRKVKADPLVSAFFGVKK